MPSSHATEGDARAPAPPDDRSAEPDARAAELEARNAELEDRYKRALADLDNYRKRVARETERRVGEAREAVLLEWLEAVDSVDRALAQMTAEHPAYAGLRAVRDQLEAILARQGVRRVGSPGEPFDPERHDAIGVRETTAAPDRAVVDVARSGFALGDRVLRPAQVIVARAPAGDD
jgi:molecular chaperone GrpE